MKTLCVYRSQILKLVFTPSVTFWSDFRQEAKRATCWPISVCDDHHFVKCCKQCFSEIFQVLVNQNDWMMTTRQQRLRWTWQQWESCCSLGWSHFLKTGSLYTSIIIIVNILITMQILTAFLRQEVRIMCCLPISWSPFCADFCSDVNQSFILSPCCDLHVDSLLCRLHKTEDLHGGCLVGWCNKAEPNLVTLCGPRTVTLGNLSSL